MAQRHAKVKKRKPSTVGDVIRRQLGYPSMVYDRPKTYTEIRKMRRELAPHNPVEKEEIVKRFYWLKGTGDRTGRVRWTRSDGAVVKWDDSSPWPNSAVASARMWTAWEPDPSERALSMTRGRLPKSGVKPLPSGMGI
jgi:hypothetical protein